MIDKVRRVVVGAVDEIPPGERKLVVPFRGRAGIGVFNVNGTFHALRNLCPHKSGPLCTGRVGPLMVADGPPTVEDVAAHWDAINDESGYFVPVDLMDWSAKFTAHQR